MSGRVTRRNQLAYTVRFTARNPYQLPPNKKPDRARYRNRGPGVQGQSFTVECVMSDEERVYESMGPESGSVNLAVAVGGLTDDAQQCVCDMGDCGHRVCKLRVLAERLRDTAAELERLEGDSGTGEFLALVIPAGSLYYWAGKLTCYADANGRWKEGCQLAIDRGIDRPAPPS